MESARIFIFKFEYGVNTEIEGYLFDEPLPHILIPLGKDIRGKELFQTVLLVGTGKTGANGIIGQLRQNSEKKLEGIRVRLNGYLIYGDGKALLQLNDENAGAIKRFDDRLQQVSHAEESKNLTLSGEIVDPKCYFGVMKPGEGKAHRSCAIRCIAGGIPPVFHGDSTDYYLLVNEHNEPIHNEIINIVGDYITLTGKVVTWNNWKILTINTESVRQLSEIKKRSEKIIAFEKGITQCR